MFGFIKKRTGTAVRPSEAEEWIPTLLGRLRKLEALHDDQVALVARLEKQLARLAGHVHGTRGAEQARNGKELPTDPAQLKAELRRRHGLIPARLPTSPVQTDLED